MALKRFRAAPLPQPPRQYDPQYIRQFIRTLETYFSQLDSDADNFAQSYEADRFIGGQFLLNSASFTTSGTPDDSASVLLVDCTLGAVTVNLPAATANTGRVLTVKKVDATANAVTLDGDGSETIDGSLTVVFSIQYMALTLYCDGTQWWVI